MIQLRKGNIFDATCDIIIIPCNNMGGVTMSIQNELMINNLPFYNRAVSPGEILFLKNAGGFSSASTVGYAATVDLYKRKPTDEALHEIMRKLKTYCKEQDLHKVNIPLLGTGAGGLSAKTSYHIMKDAFESDHSVTLCIYAFSDDSYNELAIDQSSPQKNTIKNPRVFISYTGTDIANRNWVKRFAGKLRENGVDARLDIFHLKPGQDLPQWMTNELILADKVLLICDKFYAEKADNRKGGVGWETMIIQGDMLSKQGQNKYVAILRDDNIDQSLPIYVKSKYALNWADESQMEKDFPEFLLYLFDCDTVPPLGEIPSFVKQNLTK